MKIVEDYGKINYSLIRLNTVMSLGLISLVILLLLHAMKVIFVNADFAPSGPLAFHLLFMSTLFITSNRKLQSPYLPMSTYRIWAHVIMNMWFYVILIVNAILIGVAIYRLKMENIWIILLALPAYLSWQNHKQHEVHDTLKNEHEIEVIDEDSPSEAEVASEVTKTNPLEILWSGFITIKYQLVVSFFTILFLLLGFLYYYYLSAAFLDDYIWSFETIVRIVGKSAKGLIPITIAIIVVIPLIFGSISLSKAIIRWRLKKNQNNIDRELTTLEIDLIEYCSKSTESYVEGKTYSFLVRSVYWFVIIGFIGVMVWYIFVAIVGDGIGSNWFKVDRIAGLEWYIYLDSIGAAEVLGIFAIGIGYFAFVSHLFRNWRDLSEHNLLKSKTEHADPYDILGTLVEDIALDVRKYIITNKYTFDPASYLQFRSKSYGKWMNISTLVIFGISLCFWVLDRRDYDLFAPNFIEYTDYWTGNIHQVKYSDVVEINITCKIGQKDKLNRTYGIILNNGQEVRVTETDGSLTKNLDNWERLDKILSDQETPRIYGSSNQDSDSNGKAFNREQCAAGLIKLHGQSIANRIMRIMVK